MFEIYFNINKIKKTMLYELLNKDEIQAIIDPLAQEVLNYFILKTSISIPEDKNNKINFNISK